MKNYLTAVTLFLLACALTSCALVKSPNEKLIVGTWTPVKVEKYISPEDLEKMKTQASGTTSGTATATGAKGATGNTAKNDTASKAKMAAKGGTQGTGQGTPQQRAEQRLDRLIQAEQRSPLIIGADKIAVKNYPGNPVKGSWKMNAKGTKVTAKNFKTKEKYVLDIVEITDAKMVIIENLPIGALKINYVKEK
jgi:hypothetical protein